jgi:PAS domain S-box-containing protein
MCPLSNSEEIAADVHGDSPVASSPEVRADRKELCTVAFERTRMPMVIADATGPNNPIILANKSFLDLTGYSSSEVIGKDCRFLQGAGTSEAAIAEIRSGLAQGREVDVELINYRKDGSSFWNQLHISPIRDDAGTVIYYFASQIDVSDYRRIERLEASEHRLLKEVDHRSKNVLAVVNSIVRLSNAEDPTQYAASIQHRIEALALVHVLLASKGWAPIPLGELIGQQIRSFGSFRAELHGPDEVAVDAVNAQPVALVIHELSANAATHGSLASPSGTISITWRVSASGGYEIDWLERGGAAPRHERKPGFGSVMVDGLVRRQMGGTIERDWADDGLSVFIKLPA